MPRTAIKPTAQRATHRAPRSVKPRVATGRSDAGHFHGIILPRWARSPEARLVLARIREEQPSLGAWPASSEARTAEYLGKNAKALREMWWDAALVATDRNAFLAMEKADELIARVLECGK